MTQLIITKELLSYREQNEYKDCDTVPIVDKSCST